MGKGDLFGRILRGRTEPKNKEKEASETPVQPPAANTVERALNVPLSRRNVLGGAATSAAHAAHMATMPQAPVVIQQGVSETAAFLGPRMGSILGLTKSIMELSKPRDDSKWDYAAEKRLEITAPSITEVFAKGVPINSTGEPDLWTLRQITNIVYHLENAGLPQGLKLRDLKNQETIAEALRVSGAIGEEDNTPEDVISGERTRQAIDILQRVTGMGEESTVEDLHKTLRTKTNEMAAKIFNDKSWLQSLNPEKRREKLESLRNTLSTSHRTREESELWSQISQRSEEERSLAHQQFMQQLEEEQTSGDKRAVQDGDSETKKQGSGAEQEKSDTNSNLEERDWIECSVERTIRESRDPKDAMVFLISPTDYARHHQLQPEFPGLNRMHIQHLRQSLTQNDEKTLDNFDPATTQVETLGNDVIRVSTSDKKFQGYLSSFAGSADTLSIPNRLQMVIPPEKEEN